MTQSTNIYVGIHMVLIGGIHGYNSTCPASGHWSFRGKRICNDIDNYTCIYDANNRIITEKCDGPVTYGKGYKAVIRGNRDRKPCSHARYQPFAFSTVWNSECVFLKTVCNEEGQVVIKNGLTFEDRKCGCDNKKGYAFIDTPSHFHYCKPSEKDCSCYKQSCPLEKPYLSKDFKCIDIGNVNTTVLPDTTIRGTEVMNKETIHEDNTRKGDKRSIFCGLLVSIMFVSMIVCIGFSVYFLLTMHQEQISRNKTNEELVKCFNPHSGLWSGSYILHGSKNAFAIKLECDNCTIKGDGIDKIDIYNIRGSWNAHDGTVKFLKHYHNKNYDVKYSGKLSRDSRSMYGMYNVEDRSGKFTMSLPINDETPTLCKKVV